MKKYLYKFIIGCGLLITNGGFASLHQSLEDDIFPYRTVRQPNSLAELHFQPPSENVRAGKTDEKKKRKRPILSDWQKLKQRAANNEPGAQKELEDKLRYARERGRRLREEAKKGNALAEELVNKQRAVNQKRRDMIKKGEKEGKEEAIEEVKKEKKRLRGVYEEFKKALEAKEQWALDRKEKRKHDEHTLDKKEKKRDDEAKHRAKINEAAKKGEQWAIDTKKKEKERLRGIQEKLRNASAPTIETLKKNLQDWRINKKHLEDKNRNRDWEESDSDWEDDSDEYRPKRSKRNTAKKPSSPKIEEKEKQFTGDSETEELGTDLFNTEEPDRNLLLSETPSMMEQNTEFNEDILNSIMTQGEWSQLIYSQSHIKVV